MSTTQDARDTTGWDWDETNEAGEDDEMAFQPHHCDPSGDITDSQQADR